MAYILQLVYLFMGIANCLLTTYLTIYDSLSIGCSQLFKHYCILELLYCHDKSMIVVLPLLLSQENQISSRNMLLYLTFIILHRLIFHDFVYMQCLWYSVWFNMLILLWKSQLLAWQINCNINDCTYMWVGVRVLRTFWMGQIRSCTVWKPHNFL